MRESASSAAFRVIDFLWAASTIFEIAPVASAGWWNAPGNTKSGPGVSDRDDARIHEPLRVLQIDGLRFVERRHFELGARPLIDEHAIFDREEAAMSPLESRRDLGVPGALTDELREALGREGVVPEGPAPGLEPRIFRAK